MPISIDQPKSIRDSLRVNAMTTNHPNFHHHEDDEHESDMNAELLILCSISLAATFMGAGGDPSVFAIPGAMLASLVALLKATQEKRNWQERASNALGTSVIGATAPSAFIHWFWPDAIQKMVWQTWAFLGFCGGLLGWIVAFAFVKAVGLRSDRFANRITKRFERRYLPEDQDSKDGTDRP